MKIAVNFPSADQWTLGCSSSVYSPSLFSQLFLHMPQTRGSFTLLFSGRFQRLLLRSALSPLLCRFSQVRGSRCYFTHGPLIEYTPTAAKTWRLPVRSRCFLSLCCLRTFARWILMIDEAEDCYGTFGNEWSGAKCVLATSFSSERRQGKRLWLYLHSPGVKQGNGVFSAALVFPLTVFAVLIRHQKSHF